MATASKVVPVLTSDVAYRANIFKGTLLSLCGSGVSHRQVIMAMMLNADSESESTWQLFLHFVKDLDFDCE